MLAPSGRAPGAEAPERRTPAWRPGGEEPITPLTFEERAELGALPEGIAAAGVPGRFLADPDAPGIPTGDPGPFIDPQRLAAERATKVLDEWLTDEGREERGAELLSSVHVGEGHAIVVLHEPALPLLTGEPARVELRDRLIRAMHVYEEVTLRVVTPQGSILDPASALERQGRTPEPARATATER